MKSGLGIICWVLIIIANIVIIYTGDVNFISFILFMQILYYSFFYYILNQKTSHIAPKEKSK